MSIEKMELVTISGRMDTLDRAAALCLRSGCFQVESTDDYLKNLEGASRIVEEDPTRVPLQRLEGLVKAMGEEPDGIPPAEETPDNGDYNAAIARIEERIGSIQTEREALQTEKERLRETEQQLIHFSGLNVDLDAAQQTQYVTLRFGRLPNESVKMLDAYRDNPHILFLPVSSDKSYSWGVYAAPSAHIGDADRVFAGLFFERLAIPDVKGKATDAIAHCQARRTEIDRRLEELERSAAVYWQEERDHCLAVYAFLQQQSRVFEIRQKAVTYAGTGEALFILRGWVPARGRAALEQAFAPVEGVELAFERPDAVRQLTPPVKLKNFRLFRPYEFYVRMFGVPRYNEIDPTAFVAITYTLLYGIMFADVGQGLLLAIAGWIMYRKKKMELGRILIPCGISGSVFGLVFGSVFGFEHLLDPLYRMIGFAEKPIEVMDSMLTILLAAVVIGVALMYVAMLLNIYSCLRRRDPGGALFGPNGLTGLALYTGILLLLLSATGLVQIPAGPIWIGCIALPCLLLWLHRPLAKLINRDPDWKPESWGGYLVESLFETFEALLGYVTNTISFLRVGAFVLVHASMMTVFFTIGEMLGGVWFVLLVVVGNIVVLGLEGLLVGVQSLRLEFYEMFSRFYEGSGRAYTPLSARRSA